MRVFFRSGVADRIQSPGGLTRWSAMGADLSTDAKECCGRNCLTLCERQQPNAGVGHGGMHPAGGGPPRQPGHAGPPAGVTRLVAAARKDELTTQVATRVRTTCVVRGDAVRQRARRVA